MTSSKNKQTILSSGYEFFVFLGSDSLSFLVPVLSLNQRQLLSGVSADFLKVKFPVVICHVLTVYFLTNLFTVFLVQFCFKNRAICEFSSKLTYRAP